MILDFTLIENASLLAFALVFLGGILTSIGPCNVAMIPLVVGYVGGSRDLPRSRAFVLSLTFAIGLALTFMLLGVAAALIGGLVGASTTWWYYLVAFVCFVIGLNMLGVLHIETPLWLGGLREKNHAQRCARRVDVGSGLWLGGFAMCHSSFSCYPDLRHGKRRNWFTAQAYYSSTLLGAVCRLYWQGHLQAS